MGKLSRLGNDLYTGEVSIDFVGAQGLWYAISARDHHRSRSLGLYFKGLNFGIEFARRRRVHRSRCPADQATQDNADKIRNAVADTGHRRRRSADRGHDLRHEHDPGRRPSR